jgi:hypothetical protein
LHTPQTLTVRPTDIPRARRGLLRVSACTSSTRRHHDLSDLRVLLVADVLFRTAELGGLQVVLSLEPSDLPEERVKALARDAGLLQIHPAEAAPGEVADVRVTGHPAALDDVPDGTAGLRIDVGPTRAPGAAALPDLAADPLAVRLALLSHAHHEAVELTGPTTADAQRTLTRWRRRVAAWADEPSRPMHAETVRPARAAFDQCLDTAAALAALRRLETDTGVPAGAKFETFVHLDRVLGLELAREIGHPR